MSTCSSTRKQKAEKQKTNKKPKQNKNQQPKEKQHTIDTYNIDRNIDRTIQYRQKKTQDKNIILTYVQVNLGNRRQYTETRQS